jgi:class 3 adenylate cyclase/tetratricopeptide (TPR) repeat protein
VICGSCGSTTLEPAASCASCGAELRLACQKCGFMNLASSSFCAGCGDALAAAHFGESFDELRHVTVLFCDLVSSTELSQRLDLEDLRDILSAYHTVCANAVEAQDGHVAQYLGDGVLVYFGYPSSHEDDALRAVRCGLEILDKTKALSSYLAGIETDVVVRLGAHTGRVVMSQVGDSQRKDYLALGDTPNIAARVQAEAAPGSLLVSDATWAMVAGYVRGEPGPEAKLRGVSAPMRLWRVEGETGLTERVELTSTLTTFVGRSAELEALGDAWRRSQQDASRFVLVTGEPGVGKSRLVTAFRDELAPRPASTLLVRARPVNSNSPFRPVIELLERSLDLGPDLSPEERARRLQLGLDSVGVTDADAVGVLGPLVTLQGRGEVAGSLSPARERARTMDLLSRVLNALASAGPTLLVIEDLQWADPSTLELLTCLVASPPPPGLLGLFTARAEFGPQWSGSSDVRLVQLEPLTGAETEAVVRAVGSGKTFPGGILRRIVLSSGGIPLFAEELTRSVLDSGALIERSSSWEPAGPVAAELVPPSIEVSLTSRIDRLGSARPTALLAATIGREFSLDLLRRVSPREQSVVENDLGRLVDAGLLVGAEERLGVFVFKHALLRDAAYNMLPRDTRQEYHARVAAALAEHLGSQATDRPELIAYHLSGAGDYAAGLDYWEAAATKATGQASHIEATEHLRQAISCLHRLDPAPDRGLRELAIQMKLSQLLMTVYGWGSTDAAEACGRALALARDLGRPLELAGILWGVWSVQLLRGDMVQAIAAAEDVLGAAATIGPPLVEAGHNAVAITAMHQGDFVRSMQAAEAGLSGFTFENEHVLMDNLAIAPAVGLRTARAMALWMFGRVDEAKQEWENMLQLARSLEHPPTLAAALVYTMQSEFFQCSYRGSLQHLLPLSQELSGFTEEFFFWSAVNLSIQGAIEQTLGHHGSAAAKMREGMELFQLTGAQCGLVHVAVLNAEAFYRMGDDDEALRQLEIAEAGVENRGEGLYAPEIWRIRGRLAARAGEPEVAEPLYLEAIERARAQGARVLELRASLDLYDLFERVGQAREGSAHVVAALDGVTQGRATTEVARALKIVSSSV